jgi:aminoglycoside phosphotransferase (APT) family kinase protein
VNNSAPAAREVGTTVDLATLTAYLTDVLDPPPIGALSAELIAGGRSNPTYALTDGQRSWILRRPPYGDYVKSGHDMGREVTVMTALSETPVPVPTVVAYCQDADVLGAPFYVMDRIEGTTYRTPGDTSTLSEAQRAGLASSLVDTLVALHEVDPNSVGLAEWGRPDGYLERQLARWGRQWDAVATTERPQVAELLRRLRASMPTTSQPGIVHGDFKIDNVMVSNEDPTSILAVLDWELSTLGDTHADLGLLVSFWDEPGKMFNPITKGATALPGFPSADDIVASYVARRGIQVDDVDWYVVFSDFKIAVILEQIHRRHVAGTTAGEGFDDIGAMVAPLLDRALECASRSGHRALRATN